MSVRFNAHINPGRGPYVFKVQGITYHLSANLRTTNSQRQYSQLYFIDSGLANECRSNRNPELMSSLLKRLDDLMRKENAYANQFLNLRAREKKKNYVVVMELEINL